MFGETTLAMPDAASRTPKAPTNCHADHGARPPNAVSVKMIPKRLTNENVNVRNRPRKARFQLPAAGGIS